MVRFGISLSSSSSEEVTSAWRVRPTDHARLAEINRAVGILSSRRTPARSRPHPLRNHPVLLFNCRWGTQPTVQASTEPNGGGTVSLESPITAPSVEANARIVSRDRRGDRYFRVRESEPQTPIEAVELDDNATLATVFDSTGNVGIDSGDSASDVAVQGSFHSDTQEVDYNDKEDNNMTKNNIAIVAGDDDTEDDDYYACPKCYPVCTCDKKNMTQAKAAKGKGACVCSAANDPLPSLTSHIRKHPVDVTITPLQRWEYENGYPVDGVGDVRQWARDVGLAADNDEPVDQLKRRKLSCAINPPKYVHQEPLNLLLEDGEGSGIPKSPSSSENDEEKKQISRKGKEKVE